MVAPVMINSKHPLYSVNDVFNGIFVHGNVIGDVMFYGSGAGKLPTASAVVADVVDAVKHLGTNIMTLWSSKKLELASMEDATHQYFVRLADESNETKKKVTTLFPQAQTVVAEGVTGEYAFVTEEMSEKEFKEKAKELNIIHMIRVRF